MVMVRVIAIVPVASVTIWGTGIWMITVSPYRSVVAVVGLDVLAIVHIDIDVLFAVVNTYIFISGIDIVCLVS